MNAEELKIILDRHKKWLEGDPDGKKANLRGADLRYAILYGADLCGAILRDADLCNANLRNADLREADLYGADLCGAILRDADLCNANLRNADLREADLCGAENIPYIPLACPSDGEFTGWKVASNHLVELRIPADARRSSATTNKCRCDKAMVVGIYEMDGRKSELTEIVSDYNSYIVYRIGEMVYPDSYDENRWNECSNGIHFFVNKQDAIEYNN